MIRRCPNCRTERPLTEFYCEGTLEGHSCHWDLSGVEISEPGITRPPVPIPPPPEPTIRACPNGHAVEPGDLICPICEAPVADEFLQPSPASPVELPPEAEPTIIEGWQLKARLTSSSPVRERFIAAHQTDGRRAVLTLYAQGSEPDPAVYDAIRKLCPEHVPEVLATGRWHERFFEVAEELTGGNLSDIDVSPEDTGVVRQIVDQLGRALNAFSECGLRHRDLRPAVILVRSRDPIKLVIAGFGSARLSEFDLDIVSPLETTRYMAPEAIAGGVAAASDWWSLGMLLLEQVTRGACFEGVNEQAFLIHVIANGVPISPGLDPSLDLLLRGLLARDRRERWQWNEVRAWLAGEPVQAPIGPSAAILGVRGDRSRGSAAHGSQ
jgi:primosomal replication protein N''